MEYPACELYDSAWNATTAKAKGYAQAFATDYANRIGGGDGQLFPAPMRADKIQVYIPDIYRTLYLKHTADNKEWYDVKLRRYQLQMKDLQNSTENLEEGWQYYNNAPTGMENLTLAAGLPSFASKPHFLDGAASLQTAVEGLNARREIHDTFLDVEPNTGMLAVVHKRLQLNYQMNDLNLPEITEEAVAAATMLCESKNMSCDGLDVALQCLATPSNWEFYDGRVYMPYVSETKSCFPCLSATHSDMAITTTASVLHLSLLLFLLIYVVLYVGLFPFHRSLSVVCQAWADEHVTGTEDSADDIKDGIYWAQGLGADVRFWCFVAVGFVVAMVLGLYWGEHNVYTKILNGDGAAEDEVDDVASHYNLLG